MSVNYLKLSDFLKLEIKPFILGAFLSRIMEEHNSDKHFFYAYSFFKESKYVFRDDFDIQQYSLILSEKFNKLSGHHNWYVYNSGKTSADIRFYIYDDLNITKNAFYKLLYQKLIQSAFILDESMTEHKKNFIRGFLELRGSVDTSAKFIAQDYFYDSVIELKKAQLLTDLMDLPIQFANFNMRNLQPQFVSGENKRNAQFRINAFYYASVIGFVNEYKAKVFENAYYTKGRKTINDIVYFNVDLPETKNDTVAFIKMLNFFTNNIYKKQLTPSAIQHFRIKLGLTTDNSDKAKRNMSLVKLFNEITEDKCAICGTTKTYTNPTTGRQQFSVHHMISFKNSSDLDNIANLVKLCPTCHGKLGKGSATKNQQITSILKILHEHQEIFEFTSSYLSIDDINELAEKIWSLLG